MPRPSDVEALKQLALLGALDGDVEIASGVFADLLGASQQTASRRLIELDEEGLVTRELGLRRQRVHITDDGEAVLRNEHMLYQRLFEHSDSIDVSGTVATGLGEGQYYLSRPGYNEPFQRDLGWRPFPGTLNLELKDAEASKLHVLRRSPTFTIDRFDAEGRTFGGVGYHKATINGHPCATVLPNRTHHAGVLEIIAPERLRDALPCRDGDRLTVTVHLP